MKYFLIAGEPSGDMHAAALMSEIKKKDQNSIFRFFGGDLMQAQGGEMLVHYRQMAFMGILPVIMNLRTIAKNLEICKKELLDFRPDVLILVDYPGFNLRMARFAKMHNIKVSYYISPKIWAWKTKRITIIKKYVDNMYTIFPFETAFYQKFDYPVHYVGNPVYDMLKGKIESEPDFDSFVEKHALGNKPIIALLPGSRKHEINSLLPIMEKLAAHFNQYQFVVSGAPGFTVEYYQNIMSTGLKVIFNHTHELIKHSRAAIVASGTATLETALLGTPQVVVYKMGLGWLLEIFRKQILKTQFFSLVNLVAEKELVKELFQSEVSPEIIKNELNETLNNANYRLNMTQGYNSILENLKSEGNAAENTAGLILQSIKQTNND